MIGQVLVLSAILLSAGINDVFGETGDKVVPDVRTRQMDYAGFAKPFTDKFLKEINTNSEAFRNLFQLANYQSKPEDDEQQVTLDHCKSIHRSEATELMLKSGLLFQQTCLDAVKELSPTIDKTVADFMAELKESNEDAYTEAVACSKSESKHVPEQLVECLRAVVDEHYLSLHSYLDTLAVLYEKMTGILQNMEACERQVVESIESKITNLIDEKIMKNCVNRKEIIESYFGSVTGDLDSNVEKAISYYLKTISSLREGVKNQMDVMLTRRPLRKMIRVIGKFLENEASKMIEETNKRMEAVERLDSKFASCISDIPAEMKSLMDESVTKLSYCGASVSKLQYEFDVGLSSFAAKTDSIFASINEDAIRETCAQIFAEEETESEDEALESEDEETDLEDEATESESEAQVTCIKNELLSKIKETVVPLEKSVANFLYEQFLKYTNMDAHLTVKECISSVTKEMSDASVEFMKEIQECSTGSNRNQFDDNKDEL